MFKDRVFKRSLSSNIITTDVKNEKIKTSQK